METTKTKETIVKGAIFVILGLLISKIFNYAYHIIIARGTGPTEYGNLSIGIAVISIIGLIGAMGLHSGAERFIGYYKQKPEKTRKIITTTLSIATLTSIILGIIVWISSEIIAKEIFHNKELVILLKIFAAGIPLYAIKELSLGIFRGLENAKYQTIIRDITEPGIRIILTIIFFSIGWKLLGASSAYVIALLITTGIALYIIPWKKLKKDNEEKKIIKEIIKFSWPLTITGMLFIIAGKIDTIMLGNMRTAEEVGIYTAGLTIAGILVSGSTIMSTLFLPIAANLSQQEKKEELETSYKFIIKWTLIGTLPFFLLFIVHGKIILNLLFGAVYKEAALALTILSIGNFIAINTGPASQAIEARGKTKLVMITRIISVATNIILNVLLIPKWGITGAAFATAASLGLFKVILVFINKKHINHRFVNKETIKTVIAVLPSMLFMLILQKSGILKEDIGTSIIIILLFLLLYVVMILVMGVITKEEKETGKTLLLNTRKKFM